MGLEKQQTNQLSKLVQNEKTSFTSEITRRDFLQNAAIGGMISLGALSTVHGEKTSQETTGLVTPPKGFRSLFDGKSLKGWHALPRFSMAHYVGGSVPKISEKRKKKYIKHAAKWTVEEGVLIGAQNPHGSGYGGYLVSEETFGDYELLIDVRPDWRVDTGIILRATEAGSPGYQILVDHRPHGGIGGIFGNGLAGLHAIPFAIDAELDKTGKPIRLIEADPKDKRSEITDEKRALLKYGVGVKEFIAAWKLNEWNRFKIRCEGKHPHITTWINGLKIAEIETKKAKWVNYDADAIAKALGRKGHIALEVHSTGKWDKLGKERWWHGAVCRWKNIFIREQ